ncbi:uncharacterized protein LOC134219395 [Armigeres subalbatus]|uniref:uncharacterized protein LOC134219395 n=1 Tax=Armigeres subalbatus TaxID=124917 RepID=UPI002ED68250
MPTNYAPRYEEEFPWSAPDPKDCGSARCKWCNKTFKIDSMGRVAFVSHEKGKLHQSQVKLQGTNMKIPFPSVVQTSADIPPEKALGGTVAEAATAGKELQVEPTSSTSTHSGNLKKYVLREKVMVAEILWTLETVFTHNSNRSASADVVIFPKMFPDSDIASQMRMGRTKIGYLITYGLAPCFQDDLFKILNSTSKIVIGFDESLNKIAQRQQMDISVRYYDEMKHGVQSSYVGSAFLSSTRANDLLVGLKECFKAQPGVMKKIVQISMDGPNVNWKLLKDLSAELRDLRSSSTFEVLNIGSCGLHVVHNAFKSGAQKTLWNIDDFLYALHNLFKDVPLRRADYSAVTGSSLFPLKFCGVRWVENQRVAERACKMLPFLKVYVNAVKKQHDRKIKESHLDYKRSFVTVHNSKVFSTIAEGINDPLLEARLSFLMSMAATVEPFLKEFQTDAPMAPFLFGALVNLIKPVMERVIKPEYLKVNSKSLVSVELSDENLLTSNQVDVGFATKASLKSVSAVKESQILFFKNQCKSFYVAFLQKIIDKSPLTYSLTRYVSCLSPQVIIDSPETAKKRLSFLLDHLVDKDHLSGTQADKILVEYRTFIDEPKVKSACSTYRREATRLDTFWESILEQSSSKLPNLLVLVRDICIMSHGNATLERGFSVNKDCLIVNQEEESLVAQRIVYDAVANVGNVKDVVITKKLIQYTKNAHQRYQEALDKKKKEEDDSAKEKQRKREATRMMKNLELKKAKLVAETQKELASIDKQMKDLTK